MHLICILLCAVVHLSPLCTGQTPNRTKLHTQQTETNCGTSTCTPSVTPTSTPVQTATPTQTVTQQTCGPFVEIHSPPSVSPEEDSWLVAAASSTCIGPISYAWTCSTAVQERCGSLGSIRGSTEGDLYLPANSLLLGVRYNFTAFVFLETAGTTIHSSRTISVVPQLPTLVAVIEGGSRRASSEAVTLNAMRSFSGRTLLSHLPLEQQREYRFVWQVCKLRFEACDTQADVVEPLTVIPKANGGVLELPGSTTLFGVTWRITCTVSHPSSKRSDVTTADLSFSSTPSPVLYIISLSPTRNTIISDSTETTNINGNPGITQGGLSFITSSSFVHPATSALTLQVTASANAADALRYQWSSPMLDLADPRNTAGGNRRLQLTIPAKVLQDMVKGSQSNTEVLTITVVGTLANDSTILQTTSSVILIEVPPAPCLTCGFSPLSVSPTAEIIPGATLLTLTVQALGWRTWSVCELEYIISYRTRDDAQHEVPITDSWRRFNVTAEEKIRAPVFGLSRLYSVQYIVDVRTPYGTIARAYGPWLDIIQFKIDPVALEDHVQKLVTVATPSSDALVSASRILKDSNSPNTTTLIRHTLRLLAIATNRTSPISPITVHPRHILGARQMAVYANSLRYLLQNSKHEFSAEDISNVLATLYAIAVEICNQNTLSGRVVEINDYYPPAHQVLSPLLATVLSSVMSLLKNDAFNVAQLYKLQTSAQEVSRLIGKSIASRLSIGEGTIVTGVDCISPLKKLTSKITVIDMQPALVDNPTGCGVVYRVIRDQLYVLRTLSLFEPSERYGGPALVSLGSMVDADAFNGVVASDIVMAQHMQSPLGWLEDTCWTGWFDYDTPGNNSGSIDDEGLHNHIVNPLFVSQCSAPLSAKCETLSGQQWDQTGQTFSQPCGPSGIVCRAQDNLPEGCHDYRIRFLCPCNERNGAPVEGTFGGTRAINLYAVSSDLHQERVFDTSSSTSTGEQNGAKFAVFVADPEAESAEQSSSATTESATSESSVSTADPVEDAIEAVATEILNNVEDELDDNDDETSSRTTESGTASQIPEIQCVRYNPNSQTWETTGMSTSLVASGDPEVTGTVYECTTHRFSNFGVQRNFVPAPPTPPTPPLVPPSTLSPMPLIAPAIPLAPSSPSDDDDDDGSCSKWWIALIILAILLWCCLCLLLYVCWRKLKGRARRERERKALKKAVYDPRSDDFKQTTVTPSSYLLSNTVEGAYKTEHHDVSVDHVLLEGVSPTSGGSTEFVGPLDDDEDGYTFNDYYDFSSNMELEQRDPYGLYAVDQEYPVRPASPPVPPLPIMATGDPYGLVLPPAPPPQVYNSPLQAPMGMSPTAGGHPYSPQVALQPLESYVAQPLPPPVRSTSPPVSTQFVGDPYGLNEHAPSSPFGSPYGSPYGNISPHHTRHVTGAHHPMSPATIQHERGDHAPAPTLVEQYEQYHKQQWVWDDGDDEVLETPEEFGTQVEESSTDYPYTAYSPGGPSGGYAVM